jgi:hypothetical protein
LAIEENAAKKVKSFWDALAVHRLSAASIEIRFFKHACFDQYKIELMIFDGHARSR